MREVNSLREGIDFKIYQLQMESVLRQETTRKVGCFLPSPFPNYMDMQIGDRLVVVRVTRSKTSTCSNQSNVLPDHFSVPLRLIGSNRKSVLTNKMYQVNMY